MDLSKLSAAERAEALRKLADIEPAFPRRTSGNADGTHGGRLVHPDDEEEKAAFIEATMPTGFKQMIAAFEKCRRTDANAPWIRQ